MRNTQLVQAICEDASLATKTMPRRAPTNMHLTTIKKENDSTLTANEMELIKLQNYSNFIHRNTLEVWPEFEEVDGVHLTASISYYDIVSTAFSIIMRAITVFVNIRLACDYYFMQHYQNFMLTTICIVVPMIITTLIYANMCHQDGKFNKSLCQSMQTLLFVFLTSYLFRYWISFIYSIKCKRAELKNDKETQWKYFKRTVREESDVAFIRLFECFLEAAPQKIIQISIVLSHIDKITTLQIVAICSYFGSMAWCLSAYHRCNRYAQSDKQNIKFEGLLLQLCWHFCISVSRTLCIAFVASLFTFWTVIGCLLHAIILGSITFIIDRPKFATKIFLNYLFCLVLGVVYLFTYIAVKDAPTRCKYILYYIVCFSENIACVTLFILFASGKLVSLAFLFYPLCAMTIAFYPIGIVFMIIYYLYYHPKITARQLKPNNNN